MNPFQNIEEKAAWGNMDLFFKIHPHENELSVDLVLFPHGWKVGIVLESQQLEAYHVAYRTLCVMCVHDCACVEWQQHSAGDIMIRNIQLRHAGKYTCAVQTKVDSISIAVDLVVRGKLQQGTSSGHASVQNGNWPDMHFWPDTCFSLPMFKVSKHLNNLSYIGFRGR